MNEPQNKIADDEISNDGGNLKGSKDDNVDADNSKCPKDNVDEITDTAIADAMVEEDKYDKARIFNEEEAPTVKNIINIHPKLDIDDDDKNKDYIDVLDKEPVIQDNDNLGSSNNKWEIEPKDRVQHQYVWRIQRCLQFELGKKIEIFEKKWLFE